MSGIIGFWMKFHANYAAVTNGGSMPKVGFVFLKRKKEFLKGRTIMSYSNSCIKGLLKQHLKPYF